MRIGLATCAVLPEPDLDEAPLLAALRAAGHEAASVAWDGPDGAPESLAAYDAVCLRATWNYAHDVERFVAWAERASRVTRVLNPAPVVRWNVEKTYLRRLAARGVAIVPTVFVAAGASVDVAAVLGARAWDRVVIKPTVGAGSMLAERFAVGDGVAGGLAAAQAFLDKHVASRGMMIQRYMPSVESADAGELAVVTIGGEVSHGVRKMARFAADDERVDASSPTADEAAFAESVLRAAGEELDGASPLYARVDVMRGEGGEILLSELELVEPSLYFGLGEGSAARFVRALERVMAAHNAGGGDRV